MKRRFKPDQLLYLEAAKAEEGNRTDLWQMLFYAMREVAPDKLRDLGRMDVDEWVRSCQLDGSDVAWVRTQAASTKEMWAMSDRLWQMLEPGGAWSTQVVYTPEAIVLCWVPQSETWTAFRKRAEQTLKKYRQTVYDAQKWIQPKANQNLERDLCWLVRFQVLGHTWEEISADEPRGDVYVAEEGGRIRKAVHRLADEMGLRLRTEALPDN